jgi:hypothetical protein
MAKILDDAMESRFAGKGHWENAPMHRVLLSLVRNRPRDLVKLCSEAATHARGAGNDLIRTNDLQSVFKNYSQGRLQDTINEYRTELQGIERLLLGMKPTTIEKKTSAGSQFSTDALLKKIKKIEEGGRFTFTNGRTGDGGSGRPSDRGGARNPEPRETENGHSRQEERPGGRLRNDDSGGWREPVRRSRVRRDVSNERRRRGCRIEGIERIRRAIVDRVELAAFNHR